MRRRRRRDENEEEGRRKVYWSRRSEPRWMLRWTPLHLI
jgi:hypothetical protein